MQGNRIFKAGSAHHIYLKALNGYVLFYRTEDYIYFLTLLYVLARRYGISIEALCIMFNHIHLFVKAVDAKVFKAFCRDLQSMFASGYNKEYQLRGKLMMRSGYAPKRSRKSILSCLIYIANNPVAGHLTRTAPEYKWNLLAYFQNGHPFSEKLDKSGDRLRMREAARMADYCYRQGRPLNYAILRNIFRGLTSKEKMAITDYIINLYNPIDKESFLKRFGDWNTAVIAFESTTGSEHDVPEAWEDYSIYLNMLRLCLRHKIRPEHFALMGEDEKLRLVKLLSAVPYSTPEHIRRFLHL